MRDLSIVVLDTNVLVSALWSANGTPANIMHMMLAGEIINHYSDETLEEYKDVLFRDKFKAKFSYAALDKLMNHIIKFGKKVFVRKSDIFLPDEDDRAFYDVAKASDAYLITGNTNHYPDEGFIMAPRDFLAIKRQ